MPTRNPCATGGDAPGRSRDLVAPMTSRFQADVEAIDRLDAVKTALQVLRQATGLRIALVARVAPDSWTTCAILDDVGLGLRPGDPLDVTTTF